MNGQRMLWATCVVLPLLVTGCQTTQSRSLQPLVQFDTNLGKITLELDGEQAPRAVLNFVEYVEDGFYDGTVFHRVLQDSLVQGGGYTPDLEKKTQKLREGIRRDPDNGLRNTRGAIAMVHAPGRTVPIQSEFFLNVSDNPSLDQWQGDSPGYTVFGKVVEGMETVDRIGGTPLGPHTNYAGGQLPVVPVDAVVIRSARMMTAYNPRDLRAVIDAAEAEAQRLLREAEEARERAFRQKIEEVEAEYGKLTTTESGLQYVDMRVGIGPMPLPEDAVRFHYRATYSDGTEIADSWQSEPRSNPVSRMLPGVREGVLSMKEGGKRFMVIPPELGYGSEGVKGRIRGGATLLFEIELLAIEEAE
ncbi:MAG: peptidylprolyl isomerase [Phycisphaerales bacterium]|nr:MAG: peptidylprolyl isomerase [Phycisphaerales bacterium]